MSGTRVVWDDRFTKYDFGPGHPMHPSRLDLTIRLARQLGLLEAPGVEVVGAEPATDEELLTVHTPDLIEAVKRASRDPDADVGHGLGTDDTPAFAGVHEATATAVGATLQAVRSVWRAEATHAVNIAGGLHHAMRHRVAGFCVYNDAAVGIQWLLDQGAQRVAYVDLDVHHGDGVEQIFWNEPRVMTVSMHETGRTLFPGTGFPAETGGASAPDSAINLALPPGTGDRGWLRAFHAVIPAVVRAFAPEVIVSQHGCDCHVADPLSHLRVSIDAMQSATATMHALAHEVSQGRWVALGGGGYELVQVVPRAWSHLIGVAVHQPVSLSEPVPPQWLEYVDSAYGRTGPTEMGDLDGRPIDYGNWDEGYDPDNSVDDAIMATRQATFPGLGLDPWFG